MTWPDAVWRFAIVAGVLTMTPGLDTLLVLRSALRSGPRAAFATASGVAVGCLVWGLAAAVGVSALVTASPTAYAVLKVAGAVYLAYLGVRLLWTARTPHAAEPSEETVGVASPFSQGLTTNVLNPKIGVFYVAVLPHFLPADLPPVAGGVLLALVHGVETMVWFAGLIAGARTMRRWLASPQVQRGIDVVAGLIFVGFAVALVVVDQAH